MIQLVRSMHIKVGFFRVFTFAFIFFYVFVSFFVVV